MTVEKRLSKHARMDSNTPRPNQRLGTRVLIVREGCSREQNGLSKMTFWTAMILHDVFSSPLAPSDRDSGGPRRGSSQRAFRRKVLWSNDVIERPLRVPKS